MSRGASRAAYDFLYADYGPRLRAAGLRPIPVLNDDPDPARLMTDLPVCGVVLTGGNDVGGGQFPHLDPHAPSAAPERDSLETRVVDAALARDLPVLGVCRGMQFLHAYCGGAVSRRLGDASGHAHRGTVHPVVAVSPRAGAWFGTDAFSVNSFHDQGIFQTQLHEDFEALAVTAGDNVVEALIHRTRRLVGIAWHPERPGSDVEVDAHVFATFRDACGNRGRWV